MVRGKTHRHADKLNPSSSICLFPYVRFFAFRSCEVWPDVQTSAGLSDRWGGETPSAAAATAAATGRHPVCLVLPHQGPPRTFPAAPSAHGLPLQRWRRSTALRRWNAPLPGVLPKRVAGVEYDLPRLRCLSHIEIPGEGGQRWSPRHTRWGTRVYSLHCVPFPSILFCLFLIFLSVSLAHVRVWNISWWDGNSCLQSSGGPLQPLSSLSEKHGWVNSTLGKHTKAEISCAWFFLKETYCLCFLVFLFLSLSVLYAVCSSACKRSWKLKCQSQQNTAPETPHY